MRRSDAGYHCARSGAGRMDGISAKDSWGLLCGRCQADCDGDQIENQCGHAGSNGKSDGVYRAGAHQTNLPGQSWQEIPSGA